MKIAVLGLGNVGKNFMRILMESGPHLEASIGSKIEVMYAGDSSHLVQVEPSNSVKALMEAKLKGDISSIGEEVEMDAVLSSGIDALVDMSAASKDGEREKVLYKMAFQKGVHVVTANKSPLALHWLEIIPDAESRGLKVLFEATVAGGVPVFNLVKYSIGPSKVNRFRGIVTQTANFVLKMMLNGMPFEDAVKIAQDMGVAEADYTDDTSGLDAARKTVILANALFSRELSLREVKYSGIPELSEKDISEHGSNLKLITDISAKDGEVDVRTGFQILQDGDFLLTLGESSQGYEIITDNNGTLRIASPHDGPRETASAVMNDVMLLARDIIRH